MNLVMVWAWMIWSPDAVEHANMNAILVWAWMLRPIREWMLWSSDADEHECYNGLGVNALVIGCSPT